MVHRIYPTHLLVKPHRIRFDPTFLRRGVCPSENNKTANNNCINKWTFLKWRLGPSQPLIHDSESVPGSCQNWTLTSCDTTTANGQMSWLRKDKRIKHTGQASPGAPRPRVLHQELFHRNMPRCRMSETKQIESCTVWHCTAHMVHGGYGSKSSTRCQYLYAVMYYMSLTFGRLKGSFLTKLVVTRTSSFEEARSKQRSTMESCEPGIWKWTLVWYLAMQLIFLHLTVLRV